MQSFEKLAKEAFGSFFVASVLDQDVEDIPVLINCSPEVMLLATDSEDDLIQMPFVATATTAVAQVIGIRRTEFEALLSDRFIRHDNASLCHELLDIAVAERKADIQSPTVADHLRRETGKRQNSEEDLVWRSLMGYADGKQPTDEE